MIPSIQEPSADEKREAVHRIIANQIAYIRGVAGDMNENEARVAYAVMMLQMTQHLNLLTAQVAELAKFVHQAFQQPTLFSPEGKPIIQ